MTDIARSSVLNEDELVVVALAAAGLTWDETADVLGVSNRTVRRRLTSAADKLGTHGVTHTVAVAVARGLVTPFHTSGAVAAGNSPRNPQSEPPPLAGTPNPRERDQRRKRFLERFTEQVEESLLEMLRLGAALPDAAQQVGLTPQAVFGRAQWDRAWALRLDDALLAGRDPDIRHGTDHSYKQHRCRCPDCRAAHRRSR